MSQPITNEQMMHLISFNGNVDYEDFKTIFGEPLGTHLWNQWTKLYRFNLLRFYSTLNSEERRRILQFINKEPLTPLTLGGRPAPFIGTVTKEI